MSSHGLASSSPSLSSSTQCLTPRFTFSEGGGKMDKHWETEVQSRKDANRVGKIKHFEDYQLEELKH